MTFSRRRFLQLTSAACLVGTAAPAFQWQGTAMGAHAQIVLDHPNAEAITQRALHEINRLEEIFSLYRPHSEITRLNGAGTLAAPSFELLECLGIARRVHLITEGRFDPTVQPIWRVLANAYSQKQTPDATELAQARALCGFEHVTFDSTGVQLLPGQELTLNGIAQGYIADQIAEMMQREGVKDVLINTGEIIAMGAPTGHNGWPVTIKGEARARALTGRALATSAAFGTVLDGAGRVGHILDPRGEMGQKKQVMQVSVSAKTAAFADAISTGLCLAKDAATAKGLLRHIKDVKLVNVQTALKEI